MEQVKLFVKCIACKERWVEVIQPDNSFLYLPVGRAHNCDAVRKSRAWIGREIFNTGTNWSESRMIRKYFIISQIKHKVGKKGLTKCDGRCMNAKGPDCDCSCLGKNHGIGMIVQIGDYTPMPLTPLPTSAPQPTPKELSPHVVEAVDALTQAKELVVAVFESGMLRLPHDPAVHHIQELIDDLTKE